MIVRPDPFGIADLVSAFLVLSTSIGLPDAFLQVHAAFLICKGAGTMLAPSIFPMPVFYIGGIADVISASIIVFGNPGLLPEYKEIFAGILYLKGGLVFPSLL